MDEGRRGVSATIESAVRRQIRANIRTNLFFSGHPGNIALNPEFLELLGGLSRLKEEVRDSLVSFACECAETVLYETNQYLELDDPARERLRSLYEENFRKISNGGPIRECLESHHRKLASFVASLYPPHFPAALSEQDSLGRVTCSEYSPDTILAIHGLNPDTIEEPILDIGCGPSAGFVSLLSDMGKDVLGIDRSADGTRSGVLRTGWFDFPFETRAWGTVLANMSFSNHMRYHLANGTDRRGAYFDAYRRICGSLKSGGSFHYAPGLPEAEASLDADVFSVDYSEVGVRDVVAVKVMRIAG